MGQCLGKPQDHETRRLDLDSANKKNIQEANALVKKGKEEIAISRKERMIATRRRALSRREEQQNKLIEDLLRLEMEKINKNFASRRSPKKPLPDDLLVRYTALRQQPTD